MGMLFRYLVRLEVGRKGVVDVEVARVSPAQWRLGVLKAGVPESGEGVARMLLRDDVVLLVPLAGAEGWCSIGSTVRPSGGGA
jgi:hypothetical protein